MAEYLYDCESEMVLAAGESLTQEEQQQLFLVALEFEDIFALQSNDFGRTSKIRHSINTGDHQPIRQPVWRMPPYRREEARKLLTEMQAKDVIQRSSSPWASPIVLVGKKDGSVRFCVDYRKVNGITRKDAYPLPHVDDTLDTLSGSKWFTTLDLISGYWQVELEEKDREKTAFCTPDGLFEFKVMPFGLCIAPATFNPLHANAESLVKGRSHDTVSMETHTPPSQTQVKDAARQAIHVNDRF